PTRLETGLTSGADALVIDLDSSIAPQAKMEARAAAASFLATVPRRRNGPRLFVRVNSLDSGFAFEDLAAVIPERPDGVVMPRAQSGADVTRLAKQIDALERYAGLKDGGARILAMTTETPAALLDMRGFIGSTPRLVGLGWGKSALRVAIGAASSRDSHGHITGPFELARSLCVIAAHAAGVQAIDCVNGDMRNLGAVARECLEAARDGFTGKFAAHPAQIPIINEAFTPTEPEVAHARAVIAAFEAEGRPGVIVFQDRMLYRQDYEHAANVLSRAAAAKPSRL
ncbi:MAG: CoA ester lyase, partial [Hyphomicrobiales bacterium]|nr:CoA ester lyase [Hyphomicrobiales bacterium]